jgi:flagella basal body P-ring formation protein FlgA
VRSFASAGVLLLVVAGPAAGQAAASRQAPPRPATPPVWAVQAVAGLVAGQWGADSSAIRLEWGVLPAGAAFPAGTTARLLGRADGAWLGVAFAPPSGQPFAVRVHAGALDTVSVAARPVATGVTLAPEDVRSEEQVRWGPPTSAPGVRASAGWIARRPLLPGDVITGPAAAPAPVVKPGDAVQLEWRRGRVIVGLAGTALGTAGVGQLVRVRLEGRPGQKNGVVTGPGTVRLD